MGDCGRCGNTPDPNLGFLGQPDAWGFWRGLNSGADAGLDAENGFGTTASQAGFFDAAYFHARHADFIADLELLKILQTRDDGVAAGCAEDEADPGEVAVIEFEHQALTGLAFAPDDFHSRIALGGGMPVGEATVDAQVYHGGRDEAARLGEAKR